MVRVCVPRATARPEFAAAASGDLYVVIHVKEHAIFQREDDNLYCEVPIAFTACRARRRNRRCRLSKAKPTSKSPRERRAVRFSSCAAKVS